MSNVKVIGSSDVLSSPCTSKLMELMKLPGLHGALGNSHLAAALRLKRQTVPGTALLRGRLWQASRTISAFTVVIITIAILWYVGASSCTSFFFAYQGFLPMQARPARSGYKAHLAIALLALVATEL